MCRRPVSPPRSTQATPVVNNGTLGLPAPNKKLSEVNEMLANEAQALAAAAQTVQRITDFAAIEGVIELAAKFN